jgi:hypothetical protein
MTCTLLLVWIVSGNPNVEIISKHNSISECYRAFEEAEQMIDKQGTQLLCIEGEIHD